MIETQFKPSDLNNVHALRNLWFSGENEMAHLNSFSGESVRQATSVNAMGYGRIVYVLATIPFRVTLVIFLRAVSAFLECLHCNQKALSLGFQAQDLEIPIEQAFRQLYWGSKLLVPTYNSYSKDARYLTQYADIDRSKVQNPLIRDHMTKLFSKVRMNLGEGGLCNGSVNWFNYLCLKAYSEKHQINNRCETYKEYLSLIASIFKDGQPIQAGLLQSLIGIAEPLFFLKTLHFVIGGERVKSEDSFIESLNSLPDGLYHVRVYEVHSISVLKAGNELLAFDPNAGLIELSGASELSSILRHYLEGAKEKKVIFSRQELIGSFTYNLNKLWSRVFG